MADVKRLNYFNTQYLEENDFKDEQKYHLEMRRRHNKQFHSPGIAYGLAVTKTGAQSISVSPGMALDSEGREMVQLDAFPLNLSDTTLYPAGSTIYVTIAYDEKATDPQPQDAASPRGMTRITEKPKIQALAVPPNAAPPTDGSVIQLAKFTFTGGNVPIESQFDNSVRTSVGSVLADNAVPISKLKKELRAAGTTSLDGSVAGGNKSSIDAFTTSLDKPNSAFLLIYAYSSTPGARFSWTQEYITDATSIKQVVTFTNPGSNKFTINYRIYAVLEG